MEWTDDGLEGHDGGGGEADAVVVGTPGDAEGVAALVAAGDDCRYTLREGFHLECVELYGVIALGAGAAHAGPAGEDEDERLHERIIHGDARLFGLASLDSWRGNQ